LWGEKIEGRKELSYHDRPTECGESALKKSAPKKKEAGYGGGTKGGSRCSNGQSHTSDGDRGGVKKREGPKKKEGELFRRISMAERQAEGKYGKHKKKPCKKRRDMSGRGEY